MVKVIQILHHSLSPFKINADPKYYEEDWHVKVAKQIIKRTKKHELECWRPEKTIKSIFIRQGENRITYRIFPSIYLNFKFEFSFPLLKELREEINSHEVILHFHGIYNFHTYTLLSLTGGVAPVVAQSHGGYPVLIQLKKSSHPLRYLLLLEHLQQKVAFKNVDYFFALNEEEKNALEKFSMSTVLPMGIDFDEFKPRNKQKARERLSAKFGIAFDRADMAVHYIGRLAKEKRIDMGLKALKVLRDRGFANIVLNIAGDGPEKDYLVGLAQKLKISDRVNFLGYITGDTKVDFYNAADLVVLPSKREGSPVVLLEALACKTPVIATDVEAVREIAQHFRGGVKIIPQDSDANVLARAIEDFILYGHPNASEIDRKRGMQYHGWDVIVKNTLEVYKYLVEKYYR